MKKLSGFAISAKKIRQIDIWNDFFHANESEKYMINPTILKQKVCGHIWNMSWIQDEGFKRIGMSNLSLCLNVTQFQMHTW